MDERSTKIYNAYENSYSSLYPSLSKSILCRRYLNGYQYSDEAIKRAAQAVPPIDLIQINYIQQTTISCVGQLTANKYKPKLISNDPNYDNVVMAMQYQLDEAWEENGLESMIENSMITASWSMPWAYIRREIIGSPKKRKFKYTELSPGNVLPEPSCSRFDLSDCKYVIIKSWLRAEDIYKKYAKKANLPDYTAWYKKLTSGYYPQMNTMLLAGNWCYDNMNDKYLVIEMLENEYVYNENNDGEKICRQTIMVPSANDQILIEKEIKYAGHWCGIFAISSNSLGLPVSEATCLVWKLRPLQDLVNAAATLYHESAKNSVSGTIVASSDEIADALSDSNRGGIISARGIPVQDAIGRVPQSMIDPTYLNTVNFAINTMSSITASPENIMNSTRSGTSGKTLEGLIAVNNTSSSPQYTPLKELRESIATDFVANFSHVYGISGREVSFRGNTGELINTVVVNDDVIRALTGGITFPEDMNIKISIEEDLSNKTTRMSAIEDAMSAATVLQQFPALFNDPFIQITAARLVAGKLSGAEDLVKVISDRAATIAQQTNMMNESNLTAANANAQQAMLAATPQMPQTQEV